MNWIRENKFIAIFGGFVAAAAIALAVLLFLAQGEYAAVSDEYTAQADQLHQLQSMVPYPEQSNLKKVVGQKDSYVASIRELQAKLAKMQYHDEAVEPAQFQDMLKTAVAAASEKAKTNGVTLPDNFYLGFTEYLSAPPLREAAGPLAKELKAIGFVVSTLLDAKVKEISGITRTPLPVEAKTAVVPGPKAGPKKAGPALMERQKFEVVFLSDQGRFRQALNTITAANEQFFVIRNLQVENDQSKAPSRAGAVDPNATPGPGDPAPPPPQDPNAAPGEAPPANAWLTPIVGREKVVVTLALDLVNFAEPAAAPAAK